MGQSALYDHHKICYLFLVYYVVCHPKEIHALYRLYLVTFKAETLSWPPNHLFTPSINQNALMFQIPKLTSITRMTRTQSTGR